jgi:hypothetical protein
MSAVLKKITARAKQIRRKHPSMKWTNAIKQASKELKGAAPAAKKSARKKKATRKVDHHQTGSRKSLRRDKQRSAGAPGKRVTQWGSTYYERRKNRSDIPGTLAGIGAATLKSELKSRLEDQLGKAYVAKDKAKLKRDKKKKQKQITAIRADLRKLS